MYMYTCIHIYTYLHIYIYTIDIEYIPLMSLCIHIQDGYIHI